MCVFDSNEILGKIPSNFKENLRQNSSSFDLIINTELYKNHNLSTINKGDYIIAKVTGNTTKTLFCSPIAKTTISEFFELSNGKPYL